MEPVNKIRYPVVATEPSFGLMVRAMRAEDYMAVVAGTASAFIPWFINAKAKTQIKLHPSTLPWIMAMGGSAGLVYGFQESVMRLKGWKENDREVAKFGTE
eukprot:Nk52_evm1s1767 gene=Nk52_evmTU1s1767